MMPKGSSMSAVRRLEIRRHSLTKKGIARGRGSHLSQAGVDLARTVGSQLPHPSYVAVDGAPRHLETALSMGFAVDEQSAWPSGYVVGEVEHHDQWRWEQPFVHYAALTSDRSGLLADVAAEHSRSGSASLSKSPMG